MAEDIEGLRAKFLKLYASVPNLLRNDVIAVVDDKTYSWNAAYLEVNAGTGMGDKILKTLEKIGLFEQR